MLSLTDISRYELSYNNWGFPREHFGSFLVFIDDTKSKSATGYWTEKCDMMNKTEMRDIHHDLHVEPIPDKKKD